MKAFAPWTDSNGITIRDGDTIAHPYDGARATVVFMSPYEGPHRQWRVVYEDGITLSLFLQIGERGQAVVKNSA